MNKILGRVSVRDVLEELQKLPDDVQGYSFVVEDESEGEQANIKIEVFTKPIPKVVLGWIEPYERQVSRAYEEEFKDKEEDE